MTTTVSDFQRVFLSHQTPHLMVPLLAFPTFQSLSEFLRIILNIKLKSPRKHVAKRRMSLGKTFFIATISHLQSH
jgi:hypothetical protein